MGRLKKRRTPMVFAKTQKCLTSTTRYGESTCQTCQRRSSYFGSRHGGCAQKTSPRWRFHRHSAFGPPVTSSLQEGANQFRLPWADHFADRALSLSHVRCGLCRRCSSAGLGLSPWPKPLARDGSWKEVQKTRKGVFSTRDPSISEVATKPASWSPRSRNRSTCPKADTKHLVQTHHCFIGLRLNDVRTDLSKVVGGLNRDIELN